MVLHFLSLFFSPSYFLPSCYFIVLPKLLLLCLPYFHLPLTFLQSFHFPLLQCQVFFLVPLLPPFLSASHPSFLLAHSLFLCFLVPVLSILVSSCSLFLSFHPLLFFTSSLHPSILLSFLEPSLLPCFLPSFLLWLFQSFLASFVCHSLLLYIFPCFLASLFLFSLQSVIAIIPSELIMCFLQ